MKEFKRVCWLLAASAVLTASILGCSDQPLKPNTEVKLPAVLKTLGGQYIWDEQTKRYHYSGKFILDKIIASENRQQVLPVLVACIDDEFPTETQLNGKSVMLGILCYQALTQIVYHEPTSGRLDGDIATNWPGYITPMATIDELRSAKKAWQQVFNNKTFIFL